MIVREIVREFTIDCQLRGLSPRTVEFYDDALAKFLSPWMDSDIDEIEARDLRLRLTDFDVSTSRLNGYLRSAKRLWNWCIEEGIAVGLDPRSLKHLSDREDNRRWLSDKQVRSLLDSARSLTEMTVLMLLIGTGIRSGEARTIRRDDLDRLPVLRVSGKTGSRTIMTPRPLHRQLLRFLRGEAGSPYVFGGEHLPGRRYIYDVVRRCADRAGFPASPHDLRRFYATAYIGNGGSIVGLQQQLGHSSITMSRRYARISDPDVFDEALSANPLTNL